VLDGLNRYAYCGSNPVVYTDPKGESFILACAIFMAVTFAAADTAIQLNQIERGQRDQFNFGELALATGAGALGSYVRRVRDGRRRHPCSSLDGSDHDALHEISL
jgi:hypothetical protein